MYVCIYINPLNINNAQTKQQTVLQTKQQLVV